MTELKKKGRPPGAKNKPKTNNQLSDAREQHRIRAEQDFIYFIEVVQPKRVLGNIHRETISWWTRQEAKTHQLVLLPRDHMKSALIGLRVAWEITRNPAIRVLYISSTSNLAVKQLKFIKDILTCDNYRVLWPEMIYKEEARREKWTEREIAVDHPKRKAEYIRDPTVFTAGLTTNIVGLHCDIAVMDDVVVEGNAYTEEGREKTKNQYSLLSSIETVGAKEWIVGTRYHPKDLYSDLIQMEIEEYDELGNKIASTPLFEIKEHAVESLGDGTGQFLWPRQQRSDGAWFGFDSKILAVKRAQYLNKIHFRAQYYNDPHDVGSAPIKREQFQYYDPQWLVCINGKWHFKGNRLNVVAAVDFAFSLSAKADSSAIVVVGCDSSNNYYILDIIRFKTDKISDYYKNILSLYEKWGFRKIRCEISVAQQAIVRDLKDNYIRPNGLALAIDEHRPSRWEGTKEERINAVLEPRYANNQVWHYLSGNCQILEEELIFINPPHDDVKDALASAIDIAVPPIGMMQGTRTESNYFQYNKRFGGVQ